MPAATSPPPLGAAWSNTAPQPAPVESRVSVAATATANVASFATCASAFDGVSMQGTGATSSARRVLLWLQSNAVQNGIYEAAPNGASVDVTGNFTSGAYVKSGLTAGRLYYWLRNTAGNTITNGTVTLSESGYIAPNPGGELTITGVGNNAQLNYLAEATLERAVPFNEPNELPSGLVVRVDGGTSSPPDWWVLASSPSIVGTSPITFEPVSVAGLSPSAFGFPPWDNTAPQAASPGLAAAFSNTAPQQMASNLL